MSIPVGVVLPQSRYCEASSLRRRQTIPRSPYYAGGAKARDAKTSLQLRPKSFTSTFGRAFARDARYAARRRFLAQGSGAAFRSAQARCRSIFSVPRFFYSARGSLWLFRAEVFARSLGRGSSSQALRHVGEGSRYVAELAGHGIEQRLFLSQSLFCCCFFSCRWFVCWHCQSSRRTIPARKSR